MKKSSLSIIMPVYNAEKYLKKSLDSFVKHLTDNDELIIVNDCSIDESLKIIKNYQNKNKDKNIFLINNDKNIGAGLSRNEALEIAKGEYIGFVDADDYVDEFYFQNMLKLAEKENSDIVVSDIALVENNKEIKNNIYVNNIYSTKNSEVVNISKEVLLGNWACVSTCSKLFKKDIIKNNRFSKKKSDDILFTISAIIKANKISYCKDNYYYYYQSPDSLTRNINYEKYKDGLECLIDAIDLLYEENITYAQVYAANSYIPHICYSLDVIPLDKIKEFLNLVKAHLNNEKTSILLSNNNFIKNNRLYNSKIYRGYINDIINNNYNEIFNKIAAHESVSDKYNKWQNIDNKDFNPLVSIVIPVYNGENYLKEAIESALAQTYKNIEIIVVNDGSTDNTDAIAKEYGNKIRYFKKKNGGVASALNLAIEKMQGEYFSWLSHDDLYFPQKIENQINFLSKQNNKKVVLFSNYLLINENGRKISEVIINHKTTLIPEYTLLRGCVNGITMLIPKEAFVDCGNFNEKLRCTQDYDLWHKFLKVYPFMHMTDILAKTRIHSLQDTNMNPKAVSEGEDLWQFMIEDVSDVRKIELEGSVYNYYYKMALHLKNSPYRNTLKMCIDKCKKIDIEKYEKRPINDNLEKNLVEKVIYCLDNYGIILTIKIIIKKLVKR